MNASPLYRLLLALGVFLPTQIIGSATLFAAERPNKTSMIEYEREPVKEDIGKSRVLTVKPTNRDPTSHQKLERDDQAICQPSVEVAFDLVPMKSFLKANDISIQFEAVRKDQLLILTRPKLGAKPSEASYYLIVISLDSCSDSGSARTCSLTASAEHKIAPIENDLVRNSQARSSDDKISTALVEIAFEKTVREATLWCMAKDIIRKKIEF